MDPLSAVASDQACRAALYNGGMNTLLSIPTNENEITAPWLRDALIAGGRSDCPTISDVAVENIGAGIGMVGTILRCRLGYEGDPAGMPASVVVKLPSPHAETLQTARGLQLYWREFRFYRDLASHAAVGTPRLIYGDFDERDHRFVLVLEDLCDMASADQIEGASAARAMTAVRAIARMHGQFWNKIDLPPVSGFNEVADPQKRRLVQRVYQASIPAVFDRFGDGFSEPMRLLAEQYGHRMVEHTETLASGPLTFGHGDFRLDNMFFGADDTDDFAVVDWQVCGVRSGLYDVAYFLSSSVPVGVRREIEAEAVAEYHRVLLSMGVGNLTLEQCWQSYRQNMLGCFQTVVIAGGQLDLTAERSRRLADAFVTRTLTAIDDLDAREFLPD